MHSLQTSISTEISISYTEWHKC